MAAPKENLLSLGHLNGSEKNTFTKQREFSGNKSVNMPVLLQDDSSALHSQKHLVMHLQQRWQELKEREHTAQQQNRQLLQQFENAQDTLKEMLARNAAMKIIRMEYERYLEENSPRWQQQLKEKTQAAQKKKSRNHQKSSSSQNDVCKEHITHVKDNLQLKPRCPDDALKRLFLQQKIDDYLSSCLKNAEVMKSSAGPPTKPQKTTPSPKGYADYNQDGSSHLLHRSWLTHSQSQTARFPTRVPQSFLQPPIIPHPYPLHYPASTPGYYHPWPRQDLPSWASPQPNYPWSQPAGAAGTPSYSEALWGQLCVEEPSHDSRVSQIVGEENKMNGALGSQRERSLRSSSSRLSHELDVKPVRLSSSHGESSESDRDSSTASGETRKKEGGGRKQRASSDSERCSSSQESCGNLSAIPVPSVAVAQSSESNASSEKSSRSSSRKTKRSGRLSIRSPRSEKVAEEKSRGNGDDSESRHTGEESGSSNEAYKGEKEGTQNHEEKTDSCKESGSQREKESESDNVRNENDDAGEAEEQERSSSEQSGTEEKVEDEKEKNLEDEEKENSQTDRDDSDVEQGGDDVSAKKDATGEEADTSVEDEMEEQGGKEQPTRLKNEDTEKREQGSASSQDEEEESEGSGEEENEESNEQEAGESEKEEHRSEEDEIDSDDCIITTQEKRSNQMQIINEEAVQEEEAGETGSCNDDSNEVSDEDDVENLLAPQEQTQKKETDLKAQEKPKGSFHNVGIFQVEHDRSKTDDPNDSDEFDHFYD